jgi:DNA-3-methyladenine glycosylase
VGRIVEVEAYAGPEDRASHSRFGPAGRSAPMFGPPGHAYVYRVYGMYACLNVVVRPVGSPSAVLIRAVEPLEGADAMRSARLEHELGRRRSTRRPGADPTAVAAAEGRIGRIPVEHLATGPGLVAAAFSVEVGATGLDLCDERSYLRLEQGPAAWAADAIEATPRIGIDYAGEPWTSVPWRLFVGGAAAVSGTRSPHGRRSPMP